MRVGRRSGDAGRAATATRAEVIYTGTELLPSPYARSRAVATSGSHGPVPTAPPVIVEADSASLLPGEHTMRRRISFALVNGCTLASLGLGLLAIFLAMQGDTRIAAACLVACVGFDGLDGALARKLGVSSPFGAQMDSLADMCSFGLAAPVVVYASFAHTVPTAFAAMACILVAGCAAIRLARFNVSPKNGLYFEGVPTTIAAAIIVASMLVLPDSGPGVLAGALGVLALLMVSTFPYVKLGQLRRTPPWLLVVMVVAAWLDPSTTFSLVVGAYLLSGPLLWAKQRRAITA